MMHETSPPARSDGVLNAEDLAQERDASPHGSLEKLSFGLDQPVMFHGVRQRRHQHLGRARLTQKAEDVPLIDRSYHIFEIGLACEQNSHRVGELTAHLG